MDVDKIQKRRRVEIPVGNLAVTLAEEYGEVFGGGIGFNEGSYLVGERYA
jgi:hypothetical protein